MEDLKHTEPIANGDGRHYILPSRPSFDDYQGITDDHDGEDIELRDILAALKRRWKTLLTVSAVTFVGAAAIYLGLPPVYIRSFSMAVEPLDRLTGQDSGTSILNTIPGGLIPGGALPGGVANDYSSLITVLQSELVLNPIVQVAQAQDPDFDYERLLESLSITQAGGAKILDVSFRAQNPDLVQLVVAELQAAYLDYSTETQQMGLIRRLNDLDVQVEVQRQVVSTTQTALAQFQSENQILDLRAAGEALELRRNTVLLEQQNARITLEATLETYNNLRNQLGLQPAEAVFVANLSESPVYQSLLAQYRSLESEIAIESARFRADTPVIQALQDKQAQLLPLLEAEIERNLGNAVTATGSITPQTLSYQGSIGRDLAKELVASVNQIQVLQVQDQSLSQLYNALSNQLGSLVNLGSDFREIERNLTLAEASLQRLLAAQQELKLQLEAETNPWVIVSGYDLTTPLEPESRLLRSLVLGFVASSVLGLGVVFLLEMMDQSYHDANSASKETQLPVLALIPWGRPLVAPAQLPQRSLVAAQGQSFVRSTDRPGVQQPLSADQPGFSSEQSQFESAFQALEANLHLLSSNSSPPVLLVSSSASGEGKTTVACHLALASARANRKALLIDCDLENPQVAQYFGIPYPAHSPQLPIPGSAALPTVTPLTKDGRVDLLHFPASQFISPIDLLTNPQFDLLPKKYRDEYDLIILDSSGSLNTADTKLISQHVDAVLLVLRLEETDKSVVNGAIRDFRMVCQVPILGLIANGIKLR
ncbi:hypothetical protein GFS31_23800 [Leptolyngbya sp. BL0902]|uniref:GumC family protein n=1 Tax=Leptolyngbya sp. BL0902 TaxID=1115757 RepID=UPI0018E729EF|nr:tyrosine-protein kinase domain-containing protein [Leptolyngbya sp. BL0902]QQE65692.1 hypothetical protein GFS31_23800 [Leptolyngbya sp. BL0902]